MLMKRLNKNQSSIFCSLCFQRMISLNIFYKLTLFSVLFILFLYLFNTISHMVIVAYKDLKIKITFHSIDQKVYLWKQGRSRCTSENRIYSACHFIFDFCSDTLICSHGCVQIQRYKSPFQNHRDERVNVQKVPQSKVAVYLQYWEQKWSNTVFTVSIWTLQIFTILVLKFEQVKFNTRCYI